MSKILTIGIPTYKRVEEVLSLLNHINDNNLQKHVNVLVIDDGPSVVLADKIIMYKEFVHFIQHLENKGYARTFCELIETCKTKYVMITSDDDNIIPDNIEKLVKFLIKEKPDFASTQWLRDNKVHRGKLKSDLIKISEVGQASFHAPGIVYNKEACVPFLIFLKERITNNCQATFFYPQTILLYMLMFNKKKCMWCDLAMIEEGFALPTGLNNSQGNSYYSLNGRWSVYMSFLDCFDAMKILIPKDNISKLDLTKSYYDQQAFQRIYFVINHSYSEKSDVFLAGALFQCLKRPLHSFKILTKFLHLKLKKID